MNYKQYRTSEIYSDVNNKLSATDAEDTYTFDEDSVHQAVSNLLNCRSTERLFRPSYGNDLAMVLHEPFDDITAHIILNKLIKMFEDHEPRVQLDLNQTSVLPDVSKHQYELNITYRIKGLPDKIFSRVGILKK